MFIATSLDGYIAREDGNLDWLDAASRTIPSGEDLGYEVFMTPIDAIIMGRNSFEKVQSFGDWPYKKHTFILSNSLTTVPDELAENLDILSGSPKDIVSKIRKKGFENLYVDGGVTIQNFLQAGLITDLTITTIPIILGNGLPLFGDLSSDVQLSLTAYKGFDFGFTQSSYDVIS
ncbi:MAG: dihydrofolate reductase family protein [Parasphingorhabdus sp.]